MSKTPSAKEKSALPRPSTAETEQEGVPAVADVEGRMKKRAVNKLTKLVNDHPDEAVGALRRWLHDED